MDVVGTAVEVVKLADSKRRDTLNEAAEEFSQRHCIRIQIHKYEAFPSLDADGKQAIVGAVEIFHAIELGHTLERSIQAVPPAVIRALQDRRLPARLGYDGSRVMAANVVKSSKHAVAAANDDHRLLSQPRGHEITRILHLADE